MRLILASTSPRRKELLDLMGLKYEVIPSNADETHVQGLSIEEESKRLSYIKAKAVFDKTTGDRIIIGSDTMVIKNNKIYEKPKNINNAVEMLKELNNSSHTVITSLSVLAQKGEEYKEKTIYDTAEIYIKKMTEEEILKWVEEEKTLDKAGAYAIQSKFGVHIEKIVGNYTTVVGLPTHILYDILKEI